MATWLLAGAAAGAGLLVVALLPGPWPNPLPEGPLRSAPHLQRVRAAAAAVDAACSRGDLRAFAGAVTESHRQQLSRQLGSVDRALDAESLQALAKAPGYADLLGRPPWHGEVRGDTAVLVVPRPAGDGAQVLTFRWDGQALLLHRSRHEPGLEGPTAAGAAAERAFAEP